MKLPTWGVALLAIAANVLIWGALILLVVQGISYIMDSGGLKPLVEALWCGGNCEENQPQ